MQLLRHIFGSFSTSVFGGEYLVMRCTATRPLAEKCLRMRHQRDDMDGRERHTFSHNCYRRPRQLGINYPLVLFRGNSER